MGSKASDLSEYVKEFFNEPPPISTEDLVNSETVLREQNSAGGGGGVVGGGAQVLRNDVTLLGQRHHSGR